MFRKTEPAADIKALLMSQKFAVLSTLEERHPYLSLVAFAATEDLRTVFFATPKGSRKYENISSKAGVALLIDNRSNEISDISEAMAVTVLGTASEVGEMDRENSLSVYLEKHPYLQEFLEMPSTTLVQVEVESYILVSHFQKVSTVHMKSQPPLSHI